MRERASERLAVRYFGTADGPASSRRPPLCADRELAGNPHLKIPPKPKEHVESKDLYGVDLSLEYGAIKCRPAGGASCVLTSDAWDVCDATAAHRASERYHARILKEEEAQKEAVRVTAASTRTLEYGG